MAQSNDRIDKTVAFRRAGSVGMRRTRGLLMNTFQVGFKSFDGRRPSQRNPSPRSRDEWKAFGELQSPPSPRELFESQQVVDRDICYADARKNKGARKKIRKSFRRGWGPNSLDFHTTRTMIRHDTNACISCLHYPLVLVYWLSVCVSVA